MSNFNLGNLKPEDFKVRLEYGIALILDKPSIYMGGPSARSRRQAKEIMEFLFKPPAEHPDSGTTPGGDTGEPRADLNPHTPG